MAFTATGAKKLVDCFTGEASAAEYWVGLCSNIGGTEIAAGDTYARVSLGAAGASFGAGSAADPSLATNASEVAFAESGAAWNSGNAISYAGLFNAASAGNLLAVITLACSVTVWVAGQTVKFAAGALTISVT